MSGNAWQRLRATPGLGRLADLGMGPRAASRKTKNAGARIAGLKATESICPYCAVGCAQVVYTRGGEVVDIEGHPRSPINQGTLYPKGSASRQLVQQPGRLLKVKYRSPARRPHARLRAPGRRHARQRGELPHQEGLHGHERGPDREPGPHMTLLHGPRSGDHVRARRRHRRARLARGSRRADVPVDAGHAERRIVGGAFAPAGARPRPVVQTNSISTLYAHVRAGVVGAVVAHAWLHLYPVPAGMRAMPLVRPGH